MIQKLLRLLFRGTIESIEKQSRIKGQDEERNRRLEDRKYVDTLLLENFIDKPVMCFSNEFSDPVVGFGKKIISITQAEQPMLVIKNYLTGEEVFCFGQLFHYHEELFKQMMTMDRKALLALVYHVTHCDSYVSFSDKETKTKNSMKTYEEIRSELERSGFYKRLGH